MTRAIEIQKESVNSGFLIVLKPRRVLSSGDFTLVTTNVYKTAFQFGKVVGFTTATNTTLQTETTAVLFTEAVSSSVALDEFYYDDDTKELFIGISSGDLSTLLLIAEYEIYVSTIGIHFNRIPTDNTSLLTYFEPFIVIEPTLVTSVEDNLFGFVPVSSSQFELSNGTHFWENHVSRSSFHRANADVYHFAGKPITSNFKKIISGLVKRIEFADDRINFNIVDRIELLDADRIGPTYSTDDFPDLDTRFEDKSVREVFGIANGFQPVNVDFQEESPATSDNRDFAVIKQPASAGDLNDLTATVDSGSTATDTVLVSAQGITVGDSVFMNRVAGVDEYVIITAVDYGTNTIIHSALGGGAMTAGDTVERSFVAQIQIIQDDERFFPKFNRDYTTTFDVKGAGVASGFTFTTSMEANLSMPRNLSPSDQIIVKVYGTKELPQEGGGDFGSLDSEKNVLVNPVARIYQFLRELNIPEAEINVTQFTSLEASVQEKVSTINVQNSTDSFRTYKDLILIYLKSSLLRLYLDEDGLWSISQLGPLGAASLTLEDNDMAPVGTFRYEFNYDDIYSKITIIGDISELERAPLPDSAPIEQITKSAVSGLAEFFHSSSKVFEQETGLMDDADFDRVLKRYKFALEDRRGQLTIGAKTRIFDTNIDDVVDIQRTKMPGFDFDSTIDRIKSFAVREKRRNLKSVTLVLDDQQGIEDNSGSW